MRFVTVATTTALSAVLLSGCSFISGNSGQFKNPFAKKANAQSSYYGAQNVAQRCQIFSPRQPIPRGCRPEQVTLATAPQGQFGPASQYHPSGFPQQPQFGQPQYTSGAYGAAIDQAQYVGAQQKQPRVRKPKLRGSLSLGVEKSFQGDLLDFSVRDDLSPINSYNPQDFNEGFVQGSAASGSITQTTFTANDLGAANIFAPNGFESASEPSISFDDVWSTPASLRGGLEYIVGKNTTIFANAGYTAAEGKSGDAASVTATLFRQDLTQNFAQAVDAMGDPIPGSFVPDGLPTQNTQFIPNQEIARFNYDFSDLRQVDLEIGARQYFKPFSGATNGQTVTPFVGASVGASRVNAVDVSVGQSQAFFQQTFEGATEDNFFTVPTAANRTRLYDAQWIPQGQLNVGAEWQLTPGFALAAETGVKIQGSRDLADFTNAAGETITDASGDTYLSIPFTLRGSVNF